jgi:hypothetical protein
LYAVKSEALGVIDIMNLKDLVDILSAALTLVIAGVVAYIAVQQYRVNKMHLRYESYERRLRVFKAVQTFLSVIARDGSANFHQCTQFYSDASEAVFLFKKEIQEYIKQLYYKGIDLTTLHERLYPSDGSPGLPKGKERSKVARKKKEVLEWFLNELDNSKWIFRKHMGVQ